MSEAAAAGTLIVKGRSYRLEEALPLTLGDLRRLEQRGVDGNVLNGIESGDVSFEKLFQFFAYMLQKIDPSLTDEDIEGIEMTPGTMESVAAAAQESPDPNS